MAVRPTSVETLRHKEAKRRHIPTAELEPVMTAEDKTPLRLRMSGATATDTIALWMIDTDHNQESVFVRHACFLGVNDSYKAPKTTLRAEARASLNSDTSRPFAKPKSGGIAVKMINHLGDEVMSVFGAP